MVLSELGMSIRCTSWAWARIRVRRETRWRVTTTWSSAPKIEIMMFIVPGTVQGCTPALGGTRLVTLPTWTGSTSGTRPTTREPAGVASGAQPPWGSRRWSCGQPTKVHCVYEGTNTTYSDPGETRAHWATALCLRCWPSVAKSGSIVSVSRTQTVWLPRTNESTSEKHARVSNVAAAMCPRFVGLSLWFKFIN